MGIYRFIGTESDVGAISLRRLGQVIELPDDVAAEMMLGAGPENGYAGAVPIIPDADYRAVFQPDDETKFATPGLQLRAPAEFRGRLATARGKLQEVREALHAKSMEANGRLLAEALATQVQVDSGLSLESGVKPILASEHNQKEIAKPEVSNG